MKPIVCPLCPLHCDDVSVNDQGQLNGVDCRILRDFPLLHCLPADRGDFESRKSTSTAMRVITTGVDLNLARQLSQWQQAGRVSITIESDESIEALMQVTSRDGIVSATLADVATHADLVCMIGEVEHAWPRISEKLRLQSASDVSRHSSEIVVRRVTQWSADDVAELASALRHRDEHHEFADQWISARYAAIIIGPRAFVAHEEDLCATMLARLVRQRNAEARCVLLTLDTAATLRSVCLWNTNEVPSSKTDHDHSVFDVRVGSPLGVDSAAARVQIGGLDPGPELALAYRACSVAGLHHRGMVIRGDGSVSLPLAAVREERLPRVVELMDCD
jgi:hypothetical protein